ncbi:hypothetical protein JCM8097_008937 [Rhodosporidiobolus ruineniae]
MRTTFASLVAVVAAAASVKADRTFVVKNNAIFTSGGTALAYPTGWQADPGSSVSFGVAENWNGRIWGLTQCDFTTGAVAPNEICVTGGRNGGLQCATSGGTGVPPASLAEFNLNDSQDWLDVSLVDGFNLPIAITNNVGCPAPSCAFNINTVCPAVLSVFNNAGETVGCYTACSANLDGNPQDSANCCSGSHSTPATCPTSGVQYYDVYKSHCSDAYAYAYDESSQSALWTCDHSLGADYTITFCP